jgi:hypothetical protein
MEETWSKDKVTLYFSSHCDAESGDCGGGYDLTLAF